MIPERIVLLTVQNFQQCRRRISLIVIAHFIDLVQQQQGILNARLPDGVRDPSRHGAHICLAMSTDLRLVTDTAQTDTNILLVKRLRNAPRHGRLAGSRRSYQTDDRTASLSSQNTYRQILQYTLLHLLQSVVLCIQNLPGARQVFAVLRRLIPRQFQQRFNICPLYHRLRMTARHILIPHDLLADLLFDLLRCNQFCRCFLKLFYIGIYRVLTQFFLNILHLLPQNIVLLVLVNTTSDLLPQFISDMNDLHLTREYPRQCFETFPH